MATRSKAKGGTSAANLSKLKRNLDTARQGFEGIDPTWLQKEDALASLNRALQVSRELMDTARAFKGNGPSPGVGPAVSPRGAGAKKGPAKKTAAKKTVAKKTS